MQKAKKGRKKRAAKAPVDQKKVARLRKQLEKGQLGVDFNKLVDGLAHAMQDEQNTPF